MTPTQEQIKADVCGLLPEQVFITNNSVPTMERYYWVDTESEITSREWLMVAHEAEKSLSIKAYDVYPETLCMVVLNYGFEENQTITLNPYALSRMVKASESQRLEAIHRVCFPEKWRDA